MNISVICFLTIARPSRRLQRYSVALLLLTRHYTTSDLSVPQISALLRTVVSAFFSQTSRLSNNLRRLLTMASLNYSLPVTDPRHPSFYEPRAGDPARTLAWFHYNKQIGDRELPFYSKERFVTGINSSISWYY